MYNFELVNRTHCWRCSGGAGEMLRTNVQQDQQVSVLIWDNNFPHLLHVYPFFLGSSSPQCKRSPFSVFLRYISKACSPSQHRSRLLGYQGRRCDRPFQGLVGWERWGAPVRLVEVDVKSPCPVSEDPLFCDEAVMASPPPTLMRDVHSTLIWTTWLVVVVRDGVVLRLPAVAVREERWLTFKNTLMSDWSFM